MLQFKVGDRVRVSSFAPVESGSIGVVTNICEHNAGALRLQECNIDFGAHSRSFLSMHLQHANEPLRLFCGEVIEKWPHLARFEVEKAQGDPLKLASLLQTVYGYSASRAKVELDGLIREFCEKLRVAQAAA